MSVIGRPLPHESAREHVRGEAVYVDDLPPIRGELIVDFVGSPVAHGRIVAVDVEKARNVSGICAILVAADVPENSFGPVFHDEELLAREIVPFRGQPIVAIAGVSREAVARAKQLVRIEIDPLSAVVTIEDAISQNQFIGPERRIQRGDIATSLSSARHRLSGEFRIGGQEHFYLEANAAISIPEESGQLVVHSSTQNPTEIQAIVARILKRHMAQVTCICRRMGGGFGGKETQAALPAALAALVAAKTGRPARCVFGHEQDFQTTGKRHPYLVRYDVGFDGEGRIAGYKADFFSNGGFSADLSLAVMERTLLHAENAYFLPNCEFTGRVCRTNLPSNTAFRGFGGPQAVAAIENVIENIAAHLQIDAYQVRRLNCYRVNADNVTPYGQVVTNNTLPAVFDRLSESSDYATRRVEILKFNATSRTHLKGIALTPVKFGISFTRKSMNQANALVHVFTDGTVQVSTGGTEMGQGLNTKIRQLVAAELGVPIETVRMMPTSTERNINTSPTAASASTDLNGAAAVRASREIKGRLSKFIADCGLRIAEWDNVILSEAKDLEAREQILRSAQDDKRISFREAIKLAHEARIDLGGRAFYATPGIDFDRETGQGTPFLYYTNGAAVAEVLIDRWLGDVQVKRIDLLIDLGRMINPAIDRGQVIGGFVQGMGWVTTEALTFGPDGRLWSDSATTYKIPNVTDVPADFRIEFLDNPLNAENICGSKAVGEPPLLLAVSVWAAIKQALASATPGTVPRLDLPATNEEVLRRLTEIVGSVQWSVSSPNKDAEASKNGQATDITDHCPLTTAH
jgi:xanthine dehydrogenase large subunit